MINFEEELNKFTPSLEISGAEELVHGQDLDDMADVVVRLMKEASTRAAAQNQPMGGTTRAVRPDMRFTR